MILYCVIAGTALILLLPFQAYLPSIPWLENAQFYLFFLLTFFLIMRLPFSRALTLGFVAGLLWDSVWHQTVFFEGAVSGELSGPVPEPAEPVPIFSLGWTSLLFIGYAAMVHVFLAEKKRRAWFPFLLLSTAGVVFFLLADYFYTEIRAGIFIFPDSLLTDSVWLHILWSGVLAFLSAPIVYVAFESLRLLLTEDERKSFRDA